MTSLIDGTPKKVSPFLETKTCKQIYSGFLSSTAHDFVSLLRYLRIFKKMPMQVTSLFMKVFSFRVETKLFHISSGF